MTEADLRDYLATHLDIIEPGLELIAREYAIPNSLGASGRVDILARDRFRNVVVIELKKSDSTARSALHELFKYLALLQSEKGLRQEQLRCVLLSTDWHELLIPFSELVNTSPFSLDGRHLILEGGLPSRTEPIVPIRKCEGVIFPREFAWLTFSSLAARDEVASQLRGILAGVGLKNSIFIEMTSLNPSAVCFPYSLALPFFELSREDAMALLNQTHYPIALLPDYGELEDLIGGELEPLRNAIQGSLESRIFCLDGVRDVHEVTCSNFAAERELWRVDSIFRLGPAVCDRLLLSDDDILESMCGFARGNDDQFLRAVAPHHKMQFEEFRGTLREFLTRYGWWDEASKWLELVASVQGATVVACAYCPRQLLTRLALFLKTGDESWLPGFEMLLAKPPHFAQIRGLLAWDGVTSPPRANTVFSDWHPGAASWRLLMSDREDIDALVNAYGFNFPIVSRTPDHGLVATIRYESMTKWANQFPKAVEELADLLGPVVTF